MLISQNAIAVVNRMAQEDGAQPGQGLTFIKAILYFGIVPLAMFAVITGLVLLTNAPKKKSSQLTSID
jgi:hypothetical protein